MRQSLRNVRPLTAVLSLASAGMLALITERAVQGTRADALLATAPRSIVNVAPQLVAVPRTTNLEPIRAQALFYASRTFYTPPPNVAPQAPPHPDYRLAGTFVIPHEPTVALLAQINSGAQRKVVSGDDLDGWHVQSVERGRVVLEFDGQEIEIAQSSRQATTGLTHGTLERDLAPARPRSEALATNDSPERSMSRSESSGLVKTLGDANARNRVRELASAPPESRIEARLYRPPSP